MYEKFAYIYDDLMRADIDYRAWYMYIEEIFNEFNYKPKNILEMACGTGNLTYYLANTGYDLTCFDISSDMLSIAYNKLNKFKNVKLLNQDMVDFHINENFDVIISACDSINYIENEKNLLNTFKNVKKHLKPGGMFIFDINSYYKLKYIIGNNTFVEDREDIFYIWQNYFDEKNNIAEFYLTFFVKEENEKYIRFDETHIERAYKTNEINDLLKEASFNKIFCYDGFSFEKPKDKSERITFIAIV
ncbi:methyltransferase family protein [Keratinibaculum paraultunense]|uniref:Methyltransferase family protein n=1 Tax=Keratinibaculum paraultunense TaxID=1278232 RepID=A0A4V2UUI3_9FIRM|nr:class I SAM-dependent methyltransferase [Keratinibaculum paraultunense]QQY80360.1 class I SAM-dependent methyltransferase [Keratinibaculum paraultunense]TCS90886.1 methyltransferase family protein [Keratinibaculum paraultunense]